MKTRSFYFEFLSLTLLSIFLVFFSAAGETRAGAIEGYVKQAFDSSPISNLWVDVYDDSGNWLFGDQTDVNGYYLLTDLAAGDYKVHYSTNGTNYVSQWYNNQVSKAYANLVPVLETGTVDLGITSLVTSNAQISGTITVEGDPATFIAGVYVHLFNETHELIRSDLTDVDGYYVLSGLGVGSYTLRFSAVATDYVSEWYNDKEQDTADLITISALDDTHVVNAALALGGSISGRVTYHETGAPVVDAWIDAYDSSETWRGYARTNGNGEYQIKGLPAGPHKLQVFESYGASLNEWYQDATSFAGATEVTVTAGADNSGKDVILGGPAALDGFNWLIFMPALTHRPTP